MIKTCLPHAVRCITALDIFVKPSCWSSRNKDGRGGTLWFAWPLKHPVLYLSVLYQSVVGYYGVVMFVHRYQVAFSPLAALSVCI